MRAMVIAILVACGTLRGGADEPASPPPLGPEQIVRVRKLVQSVQTQARLLEARLDQRQRELTEDRHFQMCFNRLVMQGRVAEDFGDLDGEGGALQNDMQMRTLGAYRAAQTIVGKPDARDEVAGSRPD